jgi:hypothetical protein
LAGKRDQLNGSPLVSEEWKRARELGALFTGLAQGAAVTSCLAIG